MPESPIKPEHKLADKHLKNPGNGAHYDGHCYPNTCANVVGNNVRGVEGTQPNKKDKALIPPKKNQKNSPL
jgi:hypothetical protein